MSNISTVYDELSKLKVIDIPSHPLVKGRFIQVYNTIWQSECGESVYERESHYFEQILSSNESLQKCTPMSCFLCMIDLAINGLSIEPTSSPLCYLIPRSSAVGKNDKGQTIYEPRINLRISGYGELVLRSRTGQIKYADNPVVIYNCDKFRPYINSGKKTIEYEATIPRPQGSRIMGCFIKIVRNDGSEDYNWMLEDEIKRLEAYSGRANKYWDDSKKQYVERPNELYHKMNGQIDTGFLEAKMIKHAFKSYPKVRIGKQTQLESIEDESLPSDLYDLPKEAREVPAFIPEATGGIQVETKEDEPF